MYQCAGGGVGDGDLLRMLEDEEERPSVGAIAHMCLKSGIKKDDYRTIGNDDAWDYFYELLSKVAATRTREELYDFLGSYLFPKEIDEYLNHLESMKRKSA